MLQARIAQRSFRRARVERLVEREHDLPRQPLSSRLASMRQPRGAERVARQRPWGRSVSTLPLPPAESSALIA